MDINEYQTASVLINYLDFNFILQGNLSLVNYVNPKYEVCMYDYVMADYPQTEISTSCDNQKTKPLLTS